MKLPEVVKSDKSGNEFQNKLSRALAENSQKYVLGFMRNFSVMIMVLKIVNL